MLQCMLLFVIFEEPAAAAGAGNLFYFSCFLPPPPLLSFSEVTALILTLDCFMDLSGRIINSVP